MVLSLIVYHTKLPYKFYCKTGVMSAHGNLYSNDDQGGILEISKFKVIGNIGLKLYFEAFEMACYL